MKIILRLFFIISVIFSSKMAQANFFYHFCNFIFGKAQQSPQVLPPQELIDPNAFLKSGHDKLEWKGEKDVRLLYRRATENEYIFAEAGPKDTHDFVFSAFVDEEGFLNFNVFTKDNRGKRAKYIYAAKELEVALKHFGDRVKAMKGSWASWSDNYKQYQAARKAGLSQEDAAFSTWTGQQAKKNGFIYVTKLPKLDIDNEGREVVEVEFMRPAKENPLETVGP